MKRLILMRHAKSSWADPGQRDIERPLNKRGRRSSELIGKWLAENNYLPQHALVSNSERTRETLAKIKDELGDIPATFHSELYLADSFTILETLRTGPDVDTVLVLGHQPGIGDFASRIIREQPNDDQFHRHPTASTSIIDFDTNTWFAIDWADGKLTDFMVPRRLEET